MNRALYISRNEPDLQELKNTAYSLYKNTQDINKTLGKIAEFYHCLKEKLINTEFSEFFGLRDYYSAIKMTENRYSMKNCLKRNFSGLSTISIFEEETYKTPDLSTLSLISQNISEKNSRFLMIICTKELSYLFITKILYKLLPDCSVIIESKFENNENVSYEVLSNVIRNLENGVSTVFINANFIYSSLYDLFNQNFTVFKDRKYSRIALGSYINPRCFVNENYKAVVFIDKNENLASVDPPFLNRFEKHELKISDLSIDKHKETVKKLGI